MVSTLYCFKCSINNNFTVHAYLNHYRGISSVVLKTVAKSTENNYHNYDL